MVIALRQCEAPIESPAEISLDREGDESIRSFEGLDQGQKLVLQLVH